MADDARPLPSGWVRQFDDKNKRTFYVDTKANPPRSIWTHPADEVSQNGSTSYAPPVDAPPNSRTSVNEKGHHAHAKDSEVRHHAASGRKKGLGEKLTDKLTGTTKSERDEKKRQQREAVRLHYLFRGLN